MSVEEGLYQWWLEGKYFEATGDEKKQPYTIVIPPPNVTGKLHLGHAWDTTLQDIFNSYEAYARLRCIVASRNGPCGYRNTSESRRKLREEGISRYDLGREKFLEKAWEWKEEYASHIRQQWGKLV